MACALEKHNIDAVEQFPMRCKFGYILDFAIPDLKIDIECDGEQYHKKYNPRDRKRNGFLKKHGWTILRFKGKEIRSNINRCMLKIKSAMEGLSNDRRD